LHFSQLCLLWISISVLFKIPYQRNLTQKILGFLWILVGFKFFLEEVLTLAFNSSNLNSLFFLILFDCKNALFILLGFLCVLVGLMLSINFSELKVKIKTITLKNFISGILTILSIIFLDKNYTLFNFEKKIFNLNEQKSTSEIPNILNNPSNLRSFADFQLALNRGNFQDEFDYFDSFFTGENLFKLFLILLNLLPLALNSAWGELVTFKSKSNFLLKNLIPNPVFISLLTLLLEYFLIENIRGQGILSLYNVVNFTCYLIFICFLAYEFYVKKNFSFWAIFYFLLIVFNFIAIYMLNSSLTKNISFADNAKAIPDFESKGKFKFNFFLK